MNKIFLSLLASAAMWVPTVSAQQHYVGGDISLLPDYEKAGAIYKTNDGKKIESLLPWLHEQGMNSMRVRLFVDPDKYTGSDKDPNACQDLEYIRPLCRQIVDCGFDLMLDFHYSDTWADPVKQWTPKDWEGLTDDQLVDKIYEYTKGCLETLKADGVVPTFIQPGNEISYGMLWGPQGSSDLKKCLINSNANWDRLGRLLSSAIKACREVCPDAKIVLHTERVATVNVQNNFYNHMKRMNVDYDIIGLSYYPYFHGDINVLNTAVKSLRHNFSEKKVMIVETGYSYKWAVPGTDHDTTNVWPLSEEGQDKFAQDLVSAMEQQPNVDGIYWWWMEYNAFGTNLSNWYNAPLFDSNTGRATKALTTLCSYAKDSSSVEFTPSDNGVEEDVYYNLNGIRVDNPAVPGLYIRNGKKILVK